MEEERQARGVIDRLHPRGPGRTSGHGHPSRRGHDSPAAFSVDSLHQASLLGRLQISSQRAGRHVEARGLGGGVGLSARKLLVHCREHRGDAPVARTLRLPVGQLRPREAERVIRVEDKSHLRPKTVTAYRVALQGLDVAPGVLLGGVDPKPLRDYIVYDRSVTVATRRKRHRHLKVFFRWCVSEGYLERTPIEKVTPPKAQKKTPEFLTPEELRTLLRCIDADYELKAAADEAQPGQILWLKDLIVLAVNTGMRRGELTSLQWGDIDFASGFIDVRSSEDNPTKSGSDRRIPMTQDAREVLRRLQSERHGRGPGEHVLKGYYGDPLCGDYAGKRFKHYVRKAKLDERFCFHSLRHTCASWLVQRGVSLPMVQEILGHADSTTTQRYAHMAPDALKQAMAVLDGD